MFIIKLNQLMEVEDEYFVSENNNSSFRKAIDKFMGKGCKSDPPIFI